MPDNWSFVAAAYGLAALVLGGYWRFLCSKGAKHSEGARHSEGASTAPSEASPRKRQESGGEAAARTGKAAAP
jgi:hypothetical protein